MMIEGTVLEHIATSGTDQDSDGDLLLRRVQTFARVEGETSGGEECKTGRSNGSNMVCGIDVQHRTDDQARLLCLLQV